MEGGAQLQKGHGLHLTTLAAAHVQEWIARDFRQGILIGVLSTRHDMYKDMALQFIHVTARPQTLLCSAWDAIHPNKQERQHARLLSPFAE